jgi:hypothetical protein
MCLLRSEVAVPRYQKADFLRLTRLVSPPFPQFSSSADSLSIALICGGSDSLRTGNESWHPAENADPCPNLPSDNFDPIPTSSTKLPVHHLSVRHSCRKQGGAA